MVSSADGFVVDSAEATIVLHYLDKEGNRLGHEIRASDKRTVA